jgi:spore germination protein YaaH
MSLFQKAFDLLTYRYVEADKEYVKMTEAAQKNGYLRDLVETGDRLIAENPNVVDDVKKSENGCWMDQMYGKHHCEICDFIDECPTKLEYDWQAYLEQQPPETRAALVAQMEAKQQRISGGTSTT